MSKHNEHLQTHYKSFIIHMPLECLLPPYDSDQKFKNEVTIEVFYHTQVPTIAEIYDYRVNPVVAEMLYWPEVNKYVIDAVHNNCETFWDEYSRKVKEN